MLKGANQMENSTKYDGLAEEIILLQEQINNIGKDFFIVKAHSPTNPHWDLVVFEKEEATQYYKKILYQVKEIDWVKNKTITANFEDMDVDYIFIVIFNSKKGIDLTQPIAFKFPKSIFEKKEKERAELINKNNQLTYSCSFKRQYLSLDTIFQEKNFEKVKQYGYYNIKK